MKDRACCSAVRSLAAFAPPRCPGGVPYAAAKGRLTSLRALGSTNFRHHQFFRIFTALEGRNLVEPSGIEPLTSCMPYWGFTLPGRSANVLACQESHIIAKSL